mmetsp:Transcript_36968/g.75422  ORF Transcript_36968/g.75422 Transcript_36968/m.75422 type:complete len:211 (-) Transcript_36968:544-1176(-)
MHLSVIWRRSRSRSFSLMVVSRPEGVRSIFCRCATFAAESPERDVPRDRMDWGETASVSDVPSSEMPPRAEDPAPAPASAPDSPGRPSETECSVGSRSPMLLRSSADLLAAAAAAAASPYRCSCMCSLTPPSPISDMASRFCSVPATLRVPMGLRGPPMELPVMVVEPLPSVVSETSPSLTPMALSRALASLAAFLAAAVLRRRAWELGR